MFYVLSHNLTIYNNPVIVTGDNYNSIGDLFREQKVRINVFNISKINAEVRGGKLPRIKRLSEYLGDSYFNYQHNI